MRKITKRLPHGLALIELVIVLAISTMIMGGSFVWFQSQAPVNFYNDMRQIDSFVREVQNESATNAVPGYSDNPAVLASCNLPDRGKTETDPAKKCPIGQDEQVFGTAVGINSRFQATFTVFYLKATTPTTTPPIRPTRVEVYSQRTYQIPKTMRYAGWKRYPQTGSCTPAMASQDYSKLSPHDWGQPEPAGGYDYPLYTGATSFEQDYLFGGGNNLTVFRRQPNSMYIFRGRDFSGPNVGQSDANPADMASYGYDNPNNATQSRPCAMMLELESVEGVTTPAYYTCPYGIAPAWLNFSYNCWWNTVYWTDETYRPRFSAEIIMNVNNNNIKLQTR